jgi:hypothetical protein
VSVCVPATSTSSQTPPQNASVSQNTALSSSFSAIAKVFVPRAQMTETLNTATLQQNDQMAYQYAIAVPTIDMSFAHTSNNEQKDELAHNCDITLVFPSCDNVKDPFCD